MADWNTDRRNTRPPHGFQVMTGADLDPDHGRADRWLYIGRVGRRTCIRSGFKSHGEGCRAAWMAFDSACSIFARSPGAPGIRSTQTDSPGMLDEFTVRIDAWEHMSADLLAQVVHAAGSIRRAAKVLDVPNSTLARWVRAHRERGTWPE